MFRLAELPEIFGHGVAVFLGRIFRRMQPRAFQLLQFAGATRELHFQPLQAADGILTDGGL